ncbi:MAG: hypothetical protein KAV82_09450 [Phycisphaerae bacterium]|nr:hypothetical protein [Phycisphaerae bacterium]
MKKIKRKIARTLGALLISASLTMIGTCDVQHPPSNTQTFWGIAIAPG